MNNYYLAEFKISPVVTDVATGDFVDWETVADVLSASLADIGFESFENQQPYLKAYIASKHYSHEAVQQVLDNFILNSVTNIELVDATEIEGQDWNQEWEKNYFKPLVIDNRCVIHSSFHTDYPRCEYDIVIDPKMAFGTGHHSTTRLMVQSLFNTNINGLKIMDVGTGSAILAIIAQKLGAAEVTGIEIDEAAFVNAQENIALNDCTDIALVHGTILNVDPKSKFDVVLANINRNIILDDLPNYCLHLNHGGKMYLSGFYIDDVALIQEKATQCGLSVLNVSTDNNWAVVALAKP